MSAPGVQEPQMRHSAARILVVDDEPYVSVVLARWLEMEGYRSAGVLSAREALARMEEAPFELVLSDIMMPGMSGIELLTEIKSRWPDTAVIMVTGVDDRATATQALKQGAYGYVIKPFERNEILINVFNALERRALELTRKAYERDLEAKVLKRTSQIRQREEEVALRLISAAEYRDDETGAHIRRIGLFARVLAQTLGWSLDKLEMIRIAASMHDVGKIGIPDSILLKPGPLSPEEFEVIKTHTIIGSQILKGSTIPMLNMGAEIALYHHEKWNGSGYPKGLKGEEIPESARLTALIDVYDALSSDRVYRPAMSEEKALKIMREGRGVHFDPKIFDAFLETLPRFKEIKEEIPDELMEV